MCPAQSRVQGSHGRGQILRLIVFEGAKRPEPDRHEPLHAQGSAQPIRRLPRRGEHPAHAVACRASEIERAGRIARQITQQGANTLAMRFHHVEPAHEQVEQPIAHRAFVDRGGVAKTATVTLAEDPHVEVVPSESAGGSLSEAQTVFRSRWLGAK